MVLLSDMVDNSDLPFDRDTYPLSGGLHTADTPCVTVRLPLAPRRRPLTSHFGIVNLSRTQRNGGVETEGHIPLKVSPELFRGSRLPAALPLSCSTSQTVPARLRGNDEQGGGGDRDKSGHESDRMRQETVAHDQQI